MEVSIARLSTIWSRLQNSNLVLTKKPTSPNMAEFLKDLNMAVPVTEFEIGAGELVKHLSRTGRGHFFRYIHIADLTHLLLLTDGGPIVSELGLLGIVSLRWNRARKEFTMLPCDTMDTALNSVIAPQDYAGEVNESSDSEEPLGISSERLSAPARGRGANRGRGVRPSRAHNGNKHHDDARPRDSRAGDSYNNGYNNSYSRTNDSRTNDTSQPRGNRSKDKYSRKNKQPVVPPLSLEQYTIILNEAKNQNSESHNGEKSAAEKPIDEKAECPAEKPTESVTLLTHSEMERSWADDDF